VVDAQAIDAADQHGVLEHSVRTVPDGMTALEAARPFRPDVMVTDIALPGMDGYTLARLVRQDRNSSTLYWLPFPATDARRTSSER
jgi:CheY-like chemotaxis protein